MTHIPDEAVKRAWIALEDHTDLNVNRYAVEKALESSGAVFLTDEEREAVRRFLTYQPLAEPNDNEDVWRTRWACIESAREKLS